jgi:hypothetical protein
LTLAATFPRLPRNTAKVEQIEVATKLNGNSAASMPRSIWLKIRSSGAEN